MKTLKVSAIKNGTVIDHLPAGKYIEVIRFLVLKDQKVMIGVNFDSKTFGSKDIIKIENVFLDDQQLNKIALLAPNATINIVKNQKIVKKYKLKLEEEIKDIIKCPNPKCISYLEPHTLTRKFKIVKKDPMVFKCHYCEKQYKKDEVEFA